MKARAPCAVHPLGSSTKGSRALLSPKVQFPTALQSTVSGTRVQLAARLHVLLRRPGDTLSRSSTNISRRRLPGPRNGLVGHRSWSSTNISQLLSTSTQSGIALVVRRPTSHNRVIITRLRLPPKSDSASMSPDMPSLEKTATTRALFTEALSHTCLDCLLLSNPHILLSRPVRVELHTDTGSQGTGQDRPPPKESSVSLDTCATQLSRSLNSQAQGRWAIHSRTGERTKQRRKEVLATSGPGSPRDEKRHPPCAVVLQPPRDNE